jgi:hypothetical protein
MAGLCGFCPRCCQLRCKPACSADHIWRWLFLEAPDFPAFRGGACHHPIRCVPLVGNIFIIHPGGTQVIANISMIRIILYRRVQLLSEARYAAGASSTQRRTWRSKLSFRRNCLIGTLHLGLLHTKIFECFGTPVVARCTVRMCRFRSALSANLVRQFSQM